MKKHRLYPILRLLGDNASVPSTQLAKVMYQIGLYGHGYDHEVLENSDIVHFTR